MQSKLRRTSFYVAILLFAISSSYGQSDVTQPGDLIMASSDNSPGSEGVANAIDNKTTKYLNFDLNNDPVTPELAGFIVTPSVGLTRVTGLTLQSANDAPDRDPKVITLEGSNDDQITAFGSGSWELITRIENIPSWEAVFGTDHRYQTQRFTFPNAKAYKHYRFTVLETQGPSTCCMQIAEVEVLGSTLPKDVTQPGDPAVASSDNSPGSEGVANAIDNKTTKYLNFDLNNDPQTTELAGLVVSPSIGKTLVSGITLQSANDAPDRDPKVLTLEGSNDETVDGFNAGNWEEIVRLEDIPSWETVFGSDNRYKTQVFLFDNFKPYRHYRWTVLQTQGPSTCCMQIAEVELLGTGAPQDVTQPSDAVIASSDNSPGSEGVANAIDNKTTKYLNFDLNNDAQTPERAGFVVTPSVGPTRVIGMTLQSANDAPDRDPKVLTLEGSNDDQISGFDSGTWEQIVRLEDIPSWETVFGTDNRYQTQEFFFPNDKEYKHYRWTVLETQGPSTCCMQIAEVELLAVTQSVDCEKAGFITQPTDTPALEGSAATFFVELNGPWPVQWFKNGEPIPGATQLTYTTEPLSATVATNEYSVEIVGCQMSRTVHAVLFTPSDTTSIGLNWIGGAEPGANGSPTPMSPTTIAGVWPQAYWNNFENPAGDGGFSVTDAAVVNSNNETSPVTVTFEASGEWGAGTDLRTGNGRMLNGLIEAPITVTFNNVPEGDHSIIAYSVARPLEFPQLDVTVTGAETQTVYMREMNSDEYNPAPGFYQVTSTDPANRGVGNYVQFDDVSPTGEGTIGLTITEVGGGNATLNGLQLVLNPPELGAAPAIVAQPTSGNVIAGGTLVLSVEATGSEPLTFEWRRNGVELMDGGRISGARSPTLVISDFQEGDAGRYTVRIGNSAGTIVSSAAVIDATTGDIEDRLVSHWNFDETAGLVAANSVAAGSPAELIGFLDSSSHWVPGLIGNALRLQELTSRVFVPDYPKPNAALTFSGWVRVNPDATAQPSDMPIAWNWSQNTRGQFRIGIDYDELAQPATFRLYGDLAVGPNTPGIEDSTDFTTGEWQHVALVANGSQLILYRNGQPVASVDYLGNINDPPMDWLSIGARLDDMGTRFAETTDFPFWGQLDDFALWARALSAAEIMAVYEAGLEGKDLTQVEVVRPALPPELTVSVDVNGNITIAWPADATDWILESTESLVDATWTPVEGVSNNSVTITNPQGSAFFRLRRAPSPSE